MSEIQNTMHDIEKHIIALQDEMVKALNENNTVQASVIKKEIDDLYEQQRRIALEQNGNVPKSYFGDHPHINPESDGMSKF